MHRQTTLLKTIVTTMAVIGSTAAMTAPAANALTFIPLNNGDFETGDFTGWTADSINDGFAAVVEEGTMFSFFNSTGVTLNGNFAANIRSSGPAPIDSLGILTSDTFVIGEALRFSALTETLGGNTDPVNFEVRILDTNNQTLLSEIVQTNLVAVGTEPVDGVFSTHLLDTSDFAGQNVMLEFHQNTKTPGAGFFTLIDDVETSKVPEPGTVLGSLFLLGLGIAQLQKQQTRSIPFRSSSKRC